MAIKLLDVGAIPACAAGDRRSSTPIVRRERDAGLPAGHPSGVLRQDRRRLRRLPRRGVRARRSFGGRCAPLSYFLGAGRRDAAARPDRAASARSAGSTESARRRLFQPGAVSLRRARGEVLGPAAGAVRNLRSPRFLLWIAPGHRPVVCSFGRIKLPRWENFLRDALLDALARTRGPFRFPGPAPHRSDADSTMRWSVERAALAVREGGDDHRRRLPDGVDVDEMMQFGEHLSFTPWHTLATRAARQHQRGPAACLRAHLLAASRAEPRPAREPRPGETPADYLRAQSHESE